MLPLLQRISIVLRSMKRIFSTLILWFAVAAAWAGPATDIVARIGFLSDLHVNLHTNESGPLYNRHTDEAIAAVNAAKVDLVLIAGDLTDHGRPDQMALFKKKAKQFQAPVLFIPGNHDVGHAGSPEKPRTMTREKVKLFAEKVGPNYFVAEKAGIRVVGLNSCLFGTGFPEEAEQWQLLEKALAKPAAKPTLLMEHYPLFLKDVDEPANGVWNAHPEPRKRLLALIQQAGVKAVLSGHLHRPITNRLDGVLFLSNTATAFGLPHGKQECGWMLLTVPRQGEVQFEFHRLD